MWTLLIVVMAAGGFYFLNNSDHSNHKMTNDDVTGLSSGHSHANQSKVSTEKITYVCPMHPQITSDEPGQQCPICGMDLVVANQDEASHQDGDYPNGRAPIKLSERRRQMIGLKLGKAEKRSLFRTIKAPGRAAFDPELYTAQAEYQQALRQFERVKKSPLESVKKNVQRMLESAKVRLKVMGLSNGQINSIRSDTDISESLLVYKKGGQIWIYADIFEMDLRNIEEGQSVKMSASYLEGSTIAGVVASIDQVINPETRTAKVRIQIKKSPVKLRPDSYLDVEIYVPQGKHIAIPLDAVVDTGEETFVFVYKGGGEFEPRKIIIKFRAGDDVAIAQGLEDGEEIVVSGNFLVDSESQLKGVLQEFRGD